MDENVKKNLFWILIIFVLIVGGIILYFLQPKRVKQTPVTASQIDDLEVLAPAASTDGQSIYFYDLKEKNLAKFDLQANAKIALSETIANKPMNLIWSPDRTQVIIKFLYDKNSFRNTVFADSSLTDQSTALWNYNLETKKYNRLDSKIYNPPPSGPLNPVWSADSKTIIYYLTPSGNKTTLYVSYPDNSGTDILGQIPGDIYSILSYVDDGKILYYAAYSYDTNLYNVYKFDIASQTKTTLLMDSNLAKPLDEHQIIADDGKNSFIFDLSTQAKIALPILIPDAKSAVSSDKTKLVASLLDKNDSNIEKFYIVDLQNQKTSKILDPGLDNTSYLNLIFGNNVVYFVNNKKFYEIKI